jgi:hypothetical protein
MRLTAFVVFVVCEVLLACAVAIAIYDKDYLAVISFGIAMIILLALMVVIGGNQRKYDPPECVLCQRGIKHEHTNLVRISEEVNGLKFKITPFEETEHYQSLIEQIKQESGCDNARRDYYSYGGGRS